MRVIQWSYERLTPLLILLVFGFTFCILLPWICRDLHHFVYFRGDPKAAKYEKRTRDLNDERLAKAQDYFDGLQKLMDAKDVSDLQDRRLLIHQSRQLSEPGSEALWASNAEAQWGSEGLDLTIMMVGLRRKVGNYEPGYWLQTLAELHKQVTSDTLFRHKRLFICNVDTNEITQREFYAINKTVEVIFRFGGQYPDQQAANGKYRKSKEDFAFCLAQAAMPPSRYVLTFEDDAVLKPNFFSDLYHHLHTNLPLFKERALYPKPWAFIKLYYPEKWLGYSLDYQHFMELLGIMILGGSFTVFMQYGIYYVIKRNDKAAWCQDARSNMSVLRWFIIGALYCVCLCAAIGRPYVVDTFHGTLFSHGRLIPAHNCCTPAMLYQGDVVTPLAGNISTMKHSKPYDILFDMWARDNGFQTFLAEPNMISHIGYVSTQNKQSKKPVDFIF